MQIIFTKQFRLSQSERTLIHDLTYNMFPYLELLDKGVKEPKDRKEIKVYHRLYGKENLYSEDDIIKIKHVIDKIISHIQERIIDCKEGRDTSPEGDAGGFALVVNPKDFFKMMIDNYESQIKGLNQIMSILLTETESLDDDETE